MDDKNGCMGLGIETYIEHPPFLQESEQKKQDEKPIRNPWHSRPIDVHRWSDHPEVVGVVETIWQANFDDLDAKGRSGPKPKLSFRHQLRILVLDLYVAWREDPELSIGVSMSENSWETWSRYNALGISKNLIRLINGLESKGLIDLAKGSYGGPYAPSNRITRIRAAEPMRELFRIAKFTRDDVIQGPKQECIILKAGEGDAAKQIEYEDTAATKRMRDELKAYNQVLADHFIDIPSLDRPWVERDDGKGGTTKSYIDHHHQFTRRIFSRGNWGCNGRFYGPWWQQIGKTLRNQIFINDTPTVEVDYKGLHVSILSAQKGVRIEGDPYALPAGLVSGAPPDLQRELVKKLVLTALNAKSKKAAFASFRDGFVTGHMGKGLANKELEALLVAFTDRHPHLADCVCTDQGILLMNIDSRITAVVHRFFTSKGIPVLSVHDSFIIDYTHVRLLKRMMRWAAQKVVGTELAADASGLGFDELDGDLDVQLDFEAWRETARGEGYLGRIRRWEERKGKKIIPYKRSN